jgi:hypothetical protein
MMNSKKALAIAMLSLSLGCTGLQAEKLAAKAEKPVAMKETKTPATMNAYFVGNSLIGSITLDRLHAIMDKQGIDLQFGSHLKGGTALTKHMAMLEKGEKASHFETNKLAGGKYEPGERWGDPLPKRFGNYFKAISEHKWDVLVLQPGFGSNPEPETEAFRKFVDYAIKHKSVKQIYVYTNWLQRPVVRDASGKVTGKSGLLDFAAMWEDRVPLPRGGMPMCRVTKKGYHDFLEKMNTEYAGKLASPIRMMPLGDVFSELDKRVKAGKIPGIEALYNRDPERVPLWDEKRKEQLGANIFYADRVHPVKRPHTGATIGNYVYGLMYYSVLTGRTPVGLSGVNYELDDEKDKELITALQQAVWDVVSDHPFTGLKKPAPKTRKPAHGD